MATISKIPSQEALDIEFKRDSPKKCPDSVIFETVVAFANTIGGTLYLGVEDDGSISGLHPDHHNPVALAAYIAANTMPSQSVELELIDASCPVLAISVRTSRNGIVATTGGAVMQRRLKADGTPKTVPLYPFEMTSRLAQLQKVDPSAWTVPETDMTHFDPLEMERLRQHIKANSAEPNLLELADDDLIKALGLVTWDHDQYRPTLAGLLILGRPESLEEHVPANASVFQAFSGTSVLVNDDFRLPILASIDRLEAYLRARNPAQEMEMGMYRKSVLAFEPRAMREAVVNAYSHRDYGKIGRVRVALYEDHARISSPGAFVDGVTLDNLLDVEPHGRNPLLADALKRIGLAERSGRGIDRIMVGSLMYGGMLPDYEYSTSANVIVNIPRIVPQIEVMRATIGVSNALQVNELTAPQQFVVNTLVREHACTAQAVAEDTGLRISVVDRVLQWFQSHGLVQCESETGRHIYRLTAKAGIERSGIEQSPQESMIESPTGMAGASGSPKANALTEREQQILDYAVQHGQVTVAELANALQLSASRTRTIVGQMRKRGCLEKISDKCYAVYRVLRECL